MASLDDRRDASSRREMRVFLCLKDVELAERLTIETRKRGYKSRVFHNLEVMHNASRVLPPDLIVVGDALLESSRFNGGSAVDSDDDEVLNVLRAYIYPVLESAVEPIPLIYLSNNDSFATRVKSIEYGFNSFFHTPINYSSFLNRIYHLMQRRSFSYDNIILMNNDENLIKNFAEEFKKEGMIITECSNVSEILSQLDEVDPALILINGDMENCPAGAIASVIRQEDRFFATPMMILSRRDKKQFDGVSADYGVEDVVGLPISSDDLVPICRTHIMRAKNLNYEYRYMAKRDPMTGLYNASYLFEKMSELVTSVKGRNVCGGLIYVSIDTGLTEEQQDRESQRIIAVQLGNEWSDVVVPPHIPAKIDESSYAVMIYSDDEKEIEQQVELIKFAMQKIKAQVNASSLRLNYTLGVTYFDGKVLDVHEIMKRAQTSSETGSYITTVGKTATEWSHYWGQEIKKAFEKDKFYLVYQPLANLSGEPQSFYEVFVRFRNDLDAEVLPSEFLSAAMEKGLDVDIDKWVIEQVLNLIKALAELGQQARFFVKVFPASISDRNFLSFVSEKISEIGIDPSFLVIQITQLSAEMQIWNAVEFSKNLREMGVLVVIEHLGLSGSYEDVMRQVPFDFAKIDGSLVADIYRNSKNHEIVHAITNKAHAIGGKVIAPQVEEAACLSVLFQSGVDYIQGNFLQPPGDVF